MSTKLILRLSILIAVASINGFTHAYDFDSRLNAIAFVVGQGVENNSKLNPDNILEIPHYSTGLDLRPDFSLTTEKLELDFKPRFSIRYNKTGDGINDGQSNTDDEFFLNEWLLRYKLNPQLFISYGRENLQWGPSSLLSVSSPFTVDNGRDNPRLEIPGLDYAKVIWIPDNKWAISLIANTDEGRRKTTGEFKQTFAAKIDYTGDNYYASLIPSHKEGGNNSLGWYFNKSMSDALMVHAEGSVLDKEKDSRFLVGGAYTLEDGGTLSLEYLQQQGGCTRVDFYLCFATNNSAINDRKYFRDKYALLQYSKAKVANDFTITLRALHGLEDSSSRVTTILGYEVNNKTQLFFIGDLYYGDSNSEFGSLLDYAGMLGMEYTY